MEISNVPFTGSQGLVKGGGLKFQGPVSCPLKLLGN